MAMIRATSLLVALLVPISADARLGVPDALGVLRAAMIPFELPEPFFLVPRDLPLPPVIRAKSLRLCPPSVPALGGAPKPMLAGERCCVDQNDPEIFMVCAAGARCPPMPNMRCGP